MREPARGGYVPTMSTPSHPDAGPGTDGHAPVDPTTSPDTEPDTDTPPTQPSPDASEVQDGKPEKPLEPDEGADGGRPDGEQSLPPDPTGEPST